LSTAGDLTVTGNNGGPFSIFFAGTLAAANQPQILSSTTATATTATAIDGSATPPISVTTTANPNVFNITFVGPLNSSDVLPIVIPSGTPANASITQVNNGGPTAAQVQTNLRSIPALSNVTVTGAGPSY